MTSLAAILASSEQIVSIWDARPPRVRGWATDALFQGEMTLAEAIYHHKLQIRGYRNREPLLPPRDLAAYGEMRAKFYDCARTAIPEPRARKIESLVHKIEELPSVHEVCQLLQP